MTEILPDGTSLTLEGHVTLGGQRKHPRGLMTIILAEGGIAYSLCGIQSLLVLYIAREILSPETLHTVWGMDLFWPLVNWLYAPHSIDAMAAAIMAFFMAVSCVTPLLGGLIADFRTEHRSMVLMGSLVLLCGNIALLDARAFLLALLCMIVGFGLIRGILPSQLGALYSSDDSLRADGYQYYTLGVQIAAIASPILASTIASRYGWASGFAVSGIGILFTLFVYARGRGHLPSTPPRKAREHRTRLSKNDLVAIAALLVLLVIFAAQSVPNTEIPNGYLIWGKRHFQLTFFQFEMPVSWLISLDAFISAIVMLLIVWFWQIWARFRQPPSDVQKLLIGSAVCIFGPFFLAFGGWLQPGAHQVSVLWGVAFHIVNDIGFCLVYATGMALYARVAPPSTRVTMMACFPLQAFIGNLLVGKLAGLQDRLSSEAFWLMHSAICAASFVALFILMRAFSRVFASERAQPA